MHLIQEVPCVAPLILDNDLCAKQEETVGTSLCYKAQWMEACDCIAGTPAPTFDM